MSSRTLIDYCQDGNLAGVKRVLKARSESQQQKIKKIVHADNDMPLRTASNHGHVEVVKELLKAGADVHADNDSSLQWSSTNGHVEVVKELLKAGADVHAGNDSSLRDSSKNGHTEVVRELLRAGADVHVKGDYPLRIATRNGYLKIVNELLRAGAKIPENIDSVYDSLSETKENKEMKQMCHNEEDILLQPLDTGKGIVAILTLTHDEKEHVIAECYLPNQLFHSFESQEKLNEWKYKNPEQKTGKEATDKRIYKLPSGAWIDQAGYDNFKKFNTLVLVKVGTKLIGSRFGVSRIHGSEDTIYTLKPVPRSVFINKQKFKIEDYANFTVPSEQDKNPLFGKMVEEDVEEKEDEDD